MIEDGQTSEGDSGTTPLPGAKRARYLHPLEWYEGHFQALLKDGAPPVRSRAIKRWIAIGRDAAPPELPPLDQPELLKDWWTRRMTNRVPDWICALAAVAPAAVVPAAAPASGEPAVGPLFTAAAAAPTPAAVPPAAGGSFSNALQRLRGAEAAAGELYTSLLRQASDPKIAVDARSRLTAQAEQARRAWAEVADDLRKYEKDAQQILAASGRMWMVDDVKAANDLIHVVMRDSVRGLLRRARPKLVDKTAAEQDQIWAAEVESLFAELRANKFTAPAFSSDVAAS